jgi:hypothetical protein
MNYKRALATLHHARTKKLLPKKKLENATWLTQSVEMDSGDRLIDLVLFNKHILTWYPNGDIALDTQGWMYRTTKDRYNKYLPSGFRIWQDRPFWFLKTPIGVLPFRNGMHLNEVGVDKALPDEMNGMSATMIRQQIEEYAKLYTNRLVSGRIPADLVLNRCLACVTHKQDDATPKWKSHLLQHLKDKTTPALLLIFAVNNAETGARVFNTPPYALTRQFLWDIVKASWTESQQIWRKPKSYKAMIARTEAIMTSDTLPRLDIVPRIFLRQLRMLMEDYLFESLYFERMTD